MRRSGASVGKKIVIDDIVDLRCLILSLAWMAAGVLVYIVARPPGVAFLPRGISLYEWVPSQLLVLTGPLPLFLHVGALSLLTIGILKLKGRKALRACGFWAGFDILFEFGQHVSVAAWLDEHIPVYFDKTPLLDLTRTFFNRGTFDVLDVVAAVAAAIVVYRLTTLERPRRASQ